MDISILGAGLAGLSVANHLKQGSVIYEKNKFSGGHIHSEIIDGYTWDEGPHVSFTSHEYVRNLFEENTDGDLLEYPVSTANYYKGNWIPHPAQSNLYAVPEPLRSRCLEDFFSARKKYPESYQPTNYGEWLNYSFGETFKNNFPAAYTRKYWTVDPELLTTDWVGGRVFLPDEEQIKMGAIAPLNVQTHYIKKVRYPRKGGYISFAKKMIEKANVYNNYELNAIDFENKILAFNNGYKVNYKKLVSSIPLPVLIGKSNAPADVKTAANNLSCSSILLVNVTANHTTVKPENWIYIYDEDKYSTRLYCTELLSPNNAPTGKTGIQVEVYFSKYKPLTEKPEVIAKKVCQELVEMGLIKSAEDIESADTKWVQWANVIFDHTTRANLDTVLNWLTQYGLEREVDDLEPMTNWNTKFDESNVLGDITLAGRFGQWKYFWSDDCVLRGKFIGDKLKYNL